MFLVANFILFSECGGMERRLVKITKKWYNEKVPDVLAASEDNDTGVSQKFMNSNSSCN